MRTNQDVENYMIQLGLNFEKLGEGTWMVHDENDAIDNIIVRHEPPILLCRVKLLELPANQDHTALFRTLLELNASEMLGGSYGLEGNSVVATATLQSENLDFNEFQAAVDGLTMSITDHYHTLMRHLPNVHGKTTPSA